MPIDYGVGNGVEGFSATCTAIINPGLAWSLLAEPKRNVHHIVYVNEVTSLLTVSGTVRPLEQTQCTVRTHLIIEVPCNARHASFMLLTRAINVEITQSGNQ